MKYEKGKTYHFESKIDENYSGDFVVKRIGKPRKHTGSVFIYFQFVNDYKHVQCFMIDSEFDDCCTPIYYKESCQACAFSQIEQITPIDEDNISIHGIHYKYRCSKINMVVYPDFYCPDFELPF